MLFVCLQFVFSQHLEVHSAQFLTLEVGRISLCCWKHQNPLNIRVYHNWSHCVLWFWMFGEVAYESIPCPNHPHRSYLTIPYCSIRRCSFFPSHEGYSHLYAYRQKIKNHRPHYFFTQISQISYCLIQPCIAYVPCPELLELFVSQ